MTTLVHKKRNSAVTIIFSLFSFFRSKDSKRTKGLSGKYEPLPTIDEENVAEGEDNNKVTDKKVTRELTTKSQQPQTNPFLTTSSDDATINQSPPPPGKYLVAP